MKPSPHPFYRVRVEVDSRLRIVHQSFLYTGLFDLAHAGEISLKFSWRRTACTFAVPVEIERVGDYARRRVCFDIQDQGDWFSKADLAECNAYFKRSFFAPELERLKPSHRARVRPFGPVFVTRSRSGRWSLLAGALGGIWTSAELAQSVRRLADYFRLPPIESFEREPAAPVEPLVIFQTRLWADGEVTGDSPTAAVINAERVALVRALRGRFGERFVGGLMPTSLAKERFPELICTGDTSRKAYLADMHRCLVGVYSGGLHHSTAWKLGEYLASAKCIVAPPFRNAFAAPFAEGRNYERFDSIEECVEKCAHLLDSPDRCAAMRAENSAYYREHARPPAQIMKCLTKAFEPGLARPR